jgi:RNA-binding protein Musashi
MRDNETKRSRGFGFLTFADASSVAAVMARDHYLDGKNIDPKRAVPRSEAAKSDKLFVRALPPTCTQESFRAYWRNFGQISDATLMMDKETGRHRGFGFVNYENSEAVEKVLSSGPHVMDGVTLEVKRAQTKSDNQNNQGGMGGNRGNFNNNNNNNMPYRPAPMGGMGGGMGMGGPPMGGNMAGGMGGPPGGAAPFDPQAMAKFFQQM